MQIHVLTCIGDSKAVSCLYIVHMWYQVKGGFRGIWAGVVKEDSKSECRVFLVRISDEQPTWRENKEANMESKENVLFKMVRWV